MGKPAFTPGPWEVVGLNGFGPFAIRMATPAGTKQPTHYGVGQIGTEANARLIAAAPDMYEALKAANEALAQFTAFEDDARYIMGNTNFAIVQQRREQVQAALAKAESR